MNSVRKETYSQKVYLKGISPFDVIKSFHKYDFVKFLTALQPVRINSWTGIDHNKKASFSFWFFGWRDFSVIHKNYSVEKNHLYFEDHGEDIPFGLNEWKHVHKIEEYSNGSVIYDTITIDKSSIMKRIFIHPIMLFPIFIRHLSYKIWFYFGKGK